MKLLIDIPDITYKRTLEIGALQICKDEDIYHWIANGTPIPDNATNGDMIKAMFPNQTIGCAIPITDRNGAKFYRTTINGVTDFTEDWWNAPYKAEPKAELNGEMKAMLGGSFYNR